MKYLSIISTCLLLIACDTTVENDPFQQKRNLSDAEKDYWYSGEAEITTFQLYQARYGETRIGTASLIFVTEPFSTKTWAKADNPDADDVSVMKVNFTRKFDTGIYPYSIMTSTFLPFDRFGTSLKVTTSSQEWCGHTYMELLNKDQYEIEVRSYFEGENQNLSVEKTLMEDDLWSMIRRGPNSIPTGRMFVLPGSVHLRLNHDEIKPSQAEVSVKRLDPATSQVKVNYLEIDRNISIQFESEFPYRIVGWRETHRDVPSDKEMTSGGILLKTIKLDYWNHNAKKDSIYRQELMLE